MGNDKEWKHLEMRYVVLKLEKEIDLDWLWGKLREVFVEKHLFEEKRPIKWKDIVEILINAEK